MNNLRPKTIYQPKPFFYDELKLHNFNNIDLMAYLDVLKLLQNYIQK